MVQSLCFDMDDKLRRRWKVSLVWGLIFNSIKHGDDKHQAWLLEKSKEVAQEIVDQLDDDNREEE